MKGEKTSKREAIKSLVDKLARFRELLDYDGETGVFRWRMQRAAVKRGSVAGGTLRNGYRVIGVDGHLYLAHRIAFVLVHDRDPNGYVDHIDGDITNNRIDNLREATHSQNLANSSIRSRNKTGFKGVIWRAGAWQASINYHGRSVYLGRFDDPQEAHETYLAAARCLFGEFARAA